MTINTALPSDNSVIRQHTGKGINTLRLVSEPLPTPNAHEVLVRIHAVSLNYRDLLSASGDYPWPVPPNVVPCSDSAGVVVKVGPSVTDLKEGDRVVNTFHAKYNTAMDVIADTWSGGVDGVLCGYKVFPVECLVPLPDNISFEEGACLPCAGVTAWNALYGMKHLAPGETVVLQGTGGVSALGLLIANAAGAKTILTSSSDEKLDLMKKKFGASHVVNYKKTPDWAKEVKSLTSDLGADHILDVGGPATLPPSIQCIKPNGIISLIGFVGSKPQEPIPFAFTSLPAGAMFRKIGVGSKKMLEHLVRVVESEKEKGKAGPLIDKVFPFSEEGVQEAFRCLEKQAFVSKIVIKMN